MIHLKQIAFLLTVTSFLALAGCVTNISQSSEGKLLIPEDLVLSLKQIENLERASAKGNCEASYRLFEFYAYCTSEQKLAYEYAKLAYQQGCEQAKEDVEDMKKIFEEESKLGNP